MAKIVKGETRNRPGKWIVDYRDASGKRKWITKDTLQDAKKALGEILTTKPGANYCEIDENITLAAFGRPFLENRRDVRATTRKQNLECFAYIERLIGAIKIRELTPRVILKFAETLREEELAVGTVRLILENLSIILNRARIEGVIAVNPAYGIGKQLGLQRVRDKEEVKAFTVKQRDAFLHAARDSRQYVLFRFLFGSGVRIGEALAVKADDLGGTTVRIDQTYKDGYINKPKSGKVRTVNVTDEVAGLLRQQFKKTAEAELAKGRQATWLFVNELGKPLNHSVVYKEFQRILKDAGLPAHFHTHCTRHTYASLLLSNGENVQYVQQQLGHTTIGLTCDLYGKWIPLKSSGVLERIENGNTVRDRKDILAVVR